MKIYRTDVNDIHFNLAVEAHLMDTLDRDDTALFLWRNSPTVVIGRYQNPFLECDLGAMERDGVVLARRFSGGGAVYHDLGNLCFTFIGPRQESQDWSWNFSVVCSALERLGIKASVSGRNDIVVEGCKVSGNAFQITKDRACHHGTLLVDCDMERLPLYLTPDKRKLEAHGVKSVKSRVANLVSYNKDIDVDSVASALMQAFREKIGFDCGVEVLGRDCLGPDSVYGKLCSRQWNLGQTPRFKDLLSGRNGFGSISFQLDVDKAVITGAQVFTDSLQTEGVPLLESVLVGLEYSPRALALRAGKEKDPFVREALVLLSDLVSQNSK